MRRFARPLAVWALLVFGLVVHAFAAGLLRGRVAPPLCASPVRIDLNRATAAEIAVLPGIGRARAEAVVLHRVRHGRFRSLAELDLVAGFGPETIAGIASFVELSPPR